ncbi:MAG: pseudouridine synthase [Peptoniphilaceae bacterium]|nr:pseudouridine synthase [Peptoniphilaceae bacterium]
MRINKFLAACGVSSRRKAESLIREGKVTINGKIIKELSTQVNSSDVVIYNQKRLYLPTETILYAFHKPKNMLSSHADPHTDSLIYDILPKHERLISIGRLDYETEGLLLITNNGDLAQQIAHPSKEHEKEYIVVLTQPLHPHDLQKIMQGVHFEGISYHVDHIAYGIGGWKLENELEAWPPPCKTDSIVRVILHEGKKREIRNIFRSLNYSVQRLIRVRIEDITLIGLRPGEYRKIEWVKS